MSVSSFFHYDQYGVYVYAAYGITLTVFVINVVSVFLEKKRIKKNRL